MVHTIRHGTITCIGYWHWGPWQYLVSWPGTGSSGNRSVSLQNFHWVTGKQSVISQLVVLQRCLSRCLLKTYAISIQNSRGKRTHQLVVSWYGRCSDRRFKSIRQCLCSVSKPPSLSVCVPVSFQLSWPGSPNNWPAPHVGYFYWLMNPALNLYLTRLYIKNHLL